MEHSRKYSVPSVRSAGHTKHIHQEETGEERKKRQTLFNSQLCLGPRCFHLRDAGVLLLSMFTEGNLWTSVLRKIHVYPHLPPPPPHSHPPGFTLFSGELKEILMVMRWRDTNIFLLRIKVACVSARTRVEVQVGRQSEQPVWDASGSHRYRERTPKVCDKASMMYRRRKDTSSRLRKVENQRY